MSKITIIDPSSTEWNRGSFCYLPYLFCDSKKSEGHEVVFLENFTLSDTENVDNTCPIYVSFWSPTQKDMCLELHRLFPSALFFGYYGFIEEFGLPIFRVDEHQILNGMFYQGRSFESCKSILLSDCDSHLQGKYKGQFYPMHTSYGCPNGCSFCPSSKNVNRKILRLSIEQVITKLEFYASKGYTNIHFTDEDLFLDIDRASAILQACAKIAEFNLIILGHSNTILKFINRFGKDLLYQSGVCLLEVGFEGQTLLEDKGGQSHVEHCITLASVCPDLMYWLTLTFAPGENLYNIEQTGTFLKKYGKKPEEMVPRLRTNGTEGGLGQFFQPYPDLCSNLKGLVSPFNPTRLFPSFIPESFLQCTPSFWSSSRWEELTNWSSLYGIHPNRLMFETSIGRRIEQIISKGPYIAKAKDCISIAIAARLGMIR